MGKDGVLSGRNLLWDIDLFRYLQNTFLEWAFQVDPMNTLVSLKAYSYSFTYFGRLSHKLCSVLISVIKPYLT